MPIQPSIHGTLKVPNLRGTGAGEVTQFGIIRNAALYAGHAPANFEQFRDLWHAKGLPELNKPQAVSRKEPLLVE
jgi:hypothetical protein